MHKLSNNESSQIIVQSFFKVDKNQLYDEDDMTKQLWMWIQKDQNQDFGKMSYAQTKTIYKATRKQTLIALKYWIFIP